MIKKLSIITTLILVFACNNVKEKSDSKLKTSQDYTLIEDGGIYVEFFDSTNTDPNRYTKNNSIYLVDAEFVYAFKHIDTDGNTYYYKNGDYSEDYKRDWSFVPADSKDSLTIEKVKISVNYGLEPLINHIPDYNQTILKYEYPLAGNQNSSGYSSSGAIENEKNVWIHPPRDSYFRILELNPFPFIKKPYKIGNSWNWQLKPIKL